MDYDVIIVGSGPAGTVATHTLCKSGMSVAVIERLGNDHFDIYHKICGGAVNRTILKDISLENEDIRNRVNSISIQFPDGKLMRMRCKGYILDRPAFLKRVREECETSGVSMIHGSVKDVICNDMCSVRMASGETITCRYLIGADGAFSIVRKKIFGTEPKDRIPATTYMLEDEKPNGLEFECVSDLCGGYRWRFPCGEHTCMGSLAPIENIPCSSSGVRFIPTGGLDHIVKGNVMLIGDAAAMAGPTSYGGLRTAMISGKKAAEAIMRGNPEHLETWWKGSVYADERFMKLHEYMAGLDKKGFDRLSGPLRHKSLLMNGIAGMMKNPRLCWVYLGCLMTFRHGW